MIDQIFEYKGLKQFYNKAMSIAPVIPISEWDQTKRVILMRHDVDLDVQPAFDLSKIESDCGAKSTFFFLTTCHSYNPCSLDNRIMIAEMAENGFEIGLHFDPLIYTQKEDVRKGLLMETDILEQITGRKVQSVSLHNPSMHGQYLKFDHLNNVYDPPFFNPDFYISDSRMGFRDKDPMKFIEKAREHTLQVLLHPLHFTETGGNYKFQMDTYWANFNRRVDQQFRPNNVTYAEQVPEPK